MGGEDGLCFGADFELDVFGFRLAVGLELVLRGGGEEP